MIQYHNNLILTLSYLYNCLCDLNKAISVLFMNLKVEKIGLFLLEMEIVNIMVASLME